MYNNSRPNSFNSYRAGGASIRHSSFNRPSGGGGFNKPRFGGGFSAGPRRMRRSQLEGRDVNMFIKKVEQVTQEESFAPTNTFADFEIAAALKENIAKKGFTVPTPIQDAAIGPILEGKDLIGLASTGTGKTAAFLIPVINAIYKDRNKKALIIAPTRELAVQINEELRQLAWNMRIFSALIIGGSNMRRQIFDIKRGSDVVIGTPGRIKDLIQQRQLYLEDYSIFILDEVDLMVDIGFIADVKYFISLLPAVRQSLFFSATIAPKVREILTAFVKDPITVSVKKQDTSENVEQDIVRVVSRDKKVDQLHDLLLKDGFDKVLVFGRTKHEIEKLHDNLIDRGFKVGSIHGNKSQGQRQRMLDSFKRNEIQVLLATDVASRGIDIDNVTHVINYDLPQTYEDYIHRIGRTGRAGKVGMALTFVD